MSSQQRYQLVGRVPRSSGLSGRLIAFRLFLLPAMENKKEIG